MAGEPILIVDDNASNLKLMRVLLEAEGYVVRTADHAYAALQVLREYHPRLILVDIQLPGMDGLTLTRELKANPETADIAIVALTAYAMKGDEAKALTAGCNDYITKPVDTRRLVQQIAQYVVPPASASAGV